MNSLVLCVREIVWTCFFALFNLSSTVVYVYSVYDMELEFSGLSKIQCIEYLINLHIYMFYALCQLSLKYKKCIMTLYVKYTKSSTKYRTTEMKINLNKIMFLLCISCGISCEVQLIWLFPVLFLVQCSKFNSIINKNLPVISSSHSHVDSFNPIDITCNKGNYIVKSKIKDLYCLYTETA